MNNYLADVDVEILINTIASSDGDLNLAAERLDKKLGFTYGTTKEYFLQERISSLDIQSTDKLSSKLRTLLTIKLYNLILIATNQLMGSLGDLRPAELARTHSSLVNSFSNLTTPATKITFDFDKEVQQIAEEFDVPIEDVRGELKGMDIKLKAVK
jgi:hypothetical protein